MVEQLQKAAGDGPAADLLDGLFGATRRLYKRLAQYSFFEQHDIYLRLARRPYPWLAACAENFAHVASRRVGRRIAPHEILFDAPPVQLEVEFNVQIQFPKEQCYRPLEEVSPVMQALARKQFDDYVKRVRIFVHPRAIEELKKRDDVRTIVEEAIARTAG
jgi:hypothetical protein